MSTEQQQRAHRRADAEPLALTESLADLIADMARRRDAHDADEGRA